MYEDDEDSQAIRAAFDRGPHGVTGSGGARPLSGNGFADGGIIDTHAKCRIALDAAQNEIEKLKGERDRARDLAVRSGVFTDMGGPLYALTPDDLGGAS